MDALSAIDGNVNGVKRETLGGRQSSNQSQRIFVIYDKNNEKGRAKLVTDLLSAATDIDCVVSYIDKHDKNVSEASLRNELQETHLVVLFVTKELLESIDSEKSEFSIAKELKIPILPIAEYRELFISPNFKKAMGTKHGIAFNDPEYQNNLKTQLETLLVPNELVKEICAKAFSAQLFLGYRRKDLETALNFMKKFHNIPYFEAISIWYDSFLPCGKDYKNKIKKAIVDSDVFTLLVTPNLFTEDSYVRNIEYPFAKKIGKPVVLVEAISTDPTRFAECFSGVNIDVKLDDTTSLSDIFTSKFNELDNCVCQWELDSERAYLLGKAYLHGIYVERDFDRAVKLLKHAADERLVMADRYEFAISAANQLADIYTKGIVNGVEFKINYVDALKWRKKVAFFCEKALGVECQETATAYNNIADIYKDQGKYKQALVGYGKALDIYEKVLGKDHPDTAMACNNIALIYSYQGDYEKAQKWHGKALYIYEKVLSKDHPYTATAYNNIAYIYYDLDKYGEALQYYKKALDIRERVLGKKHPDTANTYNNIATVYDKKGAYKKALKLYGKALDIYEKVLGKDHPDTATTYNNIATVYDIQGEYEKALEWYKQDLLISKRVLGKDHPDTATTYNNIAGVYDNQGKYDEALKAYGKALDIRERVLGKDHPDTAMVYNNMALVYSSRGDYNEALELFEKARGIYECVLGTNHSDTANTYNNIAQVYSSQGDYEKALELFKKALDIYERVLGINHLYTAATYNNIAQIYDKQGNYEEALEWYLKSYHIRTKKLGEKHPHTILTRANVERVYVSAGFDEPFEMWLKKNV